MKTRFCLILNLMVVVFLTTSLEAADYRAGAASRVVNPPVGSFLAGYGRDRTSTGVLDNIHVKATVISDESQSLVIVTIDNIGLTRLDVVTIQQRVANTDARITPERVIVSSTHTHSGPDVVGLWGSSIISSGRDPLYVEKLIEASVSAVVAAKAGEVPVTSRIGSGILPLEWVVNRSEPKLLDSQMAVLQFVDTSGKSVVTLTNYACHPTVLGADNTLASADYVAGFYQTMSANMPGEHLFLQGAIGGWVQPLELSEHDKPQEVMHTYGRDLADHALQLVQTNTANDDAALEFAHQTFDVELDNWGFRLMMWLGVLERDLFSGHMRTSATWFSIGEAQFVTHPGETSPAYSLQSRKLMGTQHTFVLGLTQDAMGYILKPEYFADDVAFPHAEYLTSVSVGPTAGPKLMQVLRELVPGGDEPVAER